MYKYTDKLEFAPLEKIIYNEYDIQYYALYLENDYTRQDFIKYYIRNVFPPDPMVYNHEKFVIDFIININLPICYESRVPKGMEYVTNIPDRLLLYNNGLQPHRFKEDKVTYVVENNKINYKMWFIENNKLEIRDVELTLPSFIEANGVTLEGLKHHLKQFKLKNVIKQAILTGKSLKPFIDMNDWYYISYMLHNIDTTDDIELLYDKRIIPMCDKYPNCLEELKLKAKLIDVLYCKQGSKIVLSTLVYKLLRRAFPKNPYYKTNIKIDTNNLIIRDLDWLSVIYDLGIGYDDYAINVVNILAVHVYILRRDLSKFSNIREYSFSLDNVPDKLLKKENVVMFTVSHT